jgi:hypothetical protein
MGTRVAQDRNTQDNSPEDIRGQADRHKEGTAPARMQDTAVDTVVGQDILCPRLVRMVERYGDNTNNYQQPEDKGRWD